MAKVLRNKEEILELMGKTGKAILNNGSKLALDLLYKNVKESVYDSYKPESYERTGQFLSSIKLTDIKRSGNNALKQEVVFDENLIESIKRGNGEWNAHMGMDGSSFVKPLVEVLNYGTDTGLYHRKGAFFLEDTKTELEHKLYGSNLINKYRMHYTSYDSSLDMPNYKIPSGIVVKRKI